MATYKKSPIDELFKKLMGYYPTKEGTAYEIISTAVLSLIENKDAKHNQFLVGQSDSQYQLDGLIDGNIMVEAKDYTKRKDKVGREDLQKLEGALTDLPQIKKGYFTSATEYTEPAQKYATGSSTNPLQKEIIPIELRPSTEEDEKGRISQIQVNLTMVSPDFSNGRYSILFSDEDERLKLESYLRDSGLFELHLRIEELYDSDGKVTETIENLYKQQPPEFAMDAVDVEGTFEIAAYIKVRDNLFAIKGIHYYFPINNITETFIIESNGNATMFIKSDKLGINKLITDTDMIETMKRILAK
ncbi:restriction endonuclease [Bacteroides sp.]|uniref:restriction endonuclease n=1 Tax=Bacteroides sp. TaxID=29523 RepID=UPI003AB81791